MNWNHAMQTFSPPIQLESSRLILRQWKATDFEDFANLNADLLDGYESEELIVSNLLSPPSTPKVGQEWMDLTSGIKYTYIYDGNSYQ